MVIMISRGKSNDLSTRKYFYIRDTAGYKIYENSSFDQNIKYLRKDGEWKKGHEDCGYTSLRDAIRTLMKFCPQSYYIEKEVS